MQAWNNWGVPGKCLKKERNESWKEHWRGFLLSTLDVRREHSRVGGSSSGRCDSQGRVTEVFLESAYNSRKRRAKFSFIHLVTSHVVLWESNYSQFITFLLKLLIWQIQEDQIFNPGAYQLIGHSCGGKGQHCGREQDALVKLLRKEKIEQKKVSVFLYLFFFFKLVYQGWYQTKHGPWNVPFSHVCSPFLIAMFHVNCWNVDHSNKIYIFLVLFFKFN